MISDRRWERILTIASSQLTPGESVERITFAQTYHPAWLLTFIPSSLVLQSFGHQRWTWVAFGVICTVLLTLSLTLWKGTTRYVVTTDRRILLWESAGNFGRKNDFLREVPRGTSIGSPSGSWGRSFDSLGERLYLAPFWSYPGGRTNERISSIH